MSNATCAGSASLSGFMAQLQGTVRTERHSRPHTCDWEKSRPAMVWIARFWQPERGSYG